MIEFLVSQSLLDQADIVDGNLRVLGESRRNLNFKITTDRQKHYLVKQGVGAERSATLKSEAVFLRGAWSDESFVQLRKHLPRMRAWDRLRRILVVDLLPDSQHLLVRSPARLAGQFGAVFHALHHQQLGAPDQLRGAVLDYGAPWVLRVHRPDLGILGRLTENSLRVVRILQSTPSICTGMEELGSYWRASSIIHGDVKLDNLLVTRVPGSKREWVAVLVDWEYVQLGDPLWDIGSFMAQYLDAWITSIPIDGTPTRPSAAAALLPLQRLHPPIRQFWERYAGKPGSTASTSTLERATLFAAARLIRTAIETEQMNLQLSAHSVLRLQVAENMMRRPMVAATSLFGIETTGGISERV